MAQKSSLSLISQRTRVVRPVLNLPQEGEGESDRAARLQFRRVIDSLRALVHELFRKERHGASKRRRTKQVNKGSLTEREMKPSQTNGVSLETMNEGKGVGEMTRTAVSELNGKTVLDTLSTILSSCTYDDEWDDPLMTTPLDDTASMIQPGLYISGFLAEQNKGDLESKGITHILQVGENLTQSYEHDFDYKTLPLTDTVTTNVLSCFKESLLYLDACISNGGSVLVHCYAGISRSATICIAYLMWSKNLSLGAAYSMVERARSIAQPNEGFKLQLQVFENLGSSLDCLDRYLSEHSTRRIPHRELSSDDLDGWFCPVTPSRREW